MLISLLPLVGEDITEEFRIPQRIYLTTMFVDSVPSMLRTLPFLYTSELQHLTQRENF